MQGKLTALSGRQFSQLTVLRRGHRSGNHAYWLCRCSCGAVKEVRADHLASGRIKACGTHKDKLTPQQRENSRGRVRSYRSWCGMIDRCYDPTNDNYKHYGGRGIESCGEWHLFEKFHEDMGNRPKGLSLGRLDNNAWYSKDNCQWETLEEQARNKRNTFIILYEGEEVLLIDLCKRFNMKYSVVHSRICTCKWPLMKALTHPVRAKRPNKN